MTYALVEPCYQVIGMNIAAARKHVGVSQARLAATLGKSRKHIALVEAGRERFMLHSLVVIARELRTTPGQLTDGIWR